MSNIIQEAFATCPSIPEDPDTKNLLNFFANFIRKYGVFLKNEDTFSFKFLIAYHGINESGRLTHSVILTPPDVSYGYFSEELASDKRTPFGAKSLANLLKNNGGKVTFLEKESNRDEKYDHYLVEFSINE